MLLTVGQVVRPHGIRGEVVVEVTTDEPEQRFAPGATLLTEPPGPPPADPAAWRVPPTLTVVAARPHQGRLLVEFDGIADRNLAEALRGVRLQVDSETLASPEDPDEFRDHQLIGLTAVTPTGEQLGSIARIEHGAANDLLVLARPDGRTALVPFVRAIVPEVDVAGGRIVVDPPPGLLDL
ncbi:MAG TPA: ribosome maturation factor RimM [Natronosporangium sp.]|nr:ribosome maturation factor RimM [Natronosporangium sp.]